VASVLQACLVRWRLVNNQSSSRSFGS